MKKVVFVLLLVIAGQWLSAQEGAYEVKGSVSDSSGEAIIGATITLQRDTTATTLTGAVSNEQGAYALRLPACGPYLIEVRCIGYKTQQRRVTITQPTMQVDFISYAFSAGERVKPVRTESAATLSLEKPVL